MVIILAITDRTRTLLSLPFGLAKLQAMLLQFAPGALKLTPDQVALLRTDNVVSDAAKAAGITLEGMGIASDSLEAIAPQYLWRFRAAGQFARTEPTGTAARVGVQFDGGSGLTWCTGWHLHMRRARSLAVEQGNMLFWEDVLVNELQGKAA